MNYKEHYDKLRIDFPEIDLLKKSEFNLFKDKSFALKCINQCLRLCNNAQKTLNKDVFFGIEFNYKLNAYARVKNNQGVIILNLGLIERLSIILSNSFDLFINENIAELTINSNQKEKFKQVSFECCISYIFFHELAHIIQLTSLNGENSFHFQEIYTEKDPFEIEKYIYEFDADLFGAMLSSAELMKSIIDSNFKFNSIVLFNSLTSLIFTIGNLIIEFSDNLFKKVYYLENSHPHPFIRIIKLNEQILGNISINLNIEKPFFEASLERATKMISLIEYSNGRKLDYASFYNENFMSIDQYIREIESKNIEYKELTRYKTQDFFNKLIWY